MLVLLLDGLRGLLGLKGAGGSGTANTALAFHAGKILALHEGDLPYSVSYATAKP